MTRTVHELKCWPEFFKDLVSGAKSFEIRNNDRGFKVGDRLFLREYDPKTKTYTGNGMTRDIVYITDFAQMHGFVVLGLKVNR